MHALLYDLLLPSGVEFAAKLTLTPSILKNAATSASSSSSGSLPRSLCNLVVARSNLLRIFEVRKELAPFKYQADEERDKRSRFRRDTEPVEGEVEMDPQGEGFVNMGSIKSISQNFQQTVTRLYFVREHRLHGIVTGLQGVKIMASVEDGLDRLVISFKDAKIALLEWSEPIQDLVTVSIHTYERAPQLMTLESTLFRPQLHVDPVSRCAALSLPKDSLAILPLSHVQADFDGMDQDQDPVKDVPYSPSFVLDLTKDVDEGIQNVIDFVLLPGFNSPTIAVLFQPQQTWTGRLKEYKDTAKLIIFTLDLGSHHYPVITSIEGLPYDCTSLLPCTTSMGGVIILSSNSIIYVDQAARRVILPVNGWHARVSDTTVQHAPDEQARKLELDGCRAAFVDERTILLFLLDGTVYPVELITDGKSVSKLSMSPALARTAVPTLAKSIAPDLLFVGSIAGPSVLLTVARVEEKVAEQLATLSSVSITEDVDSIMDLGDDDDIYGGTKSIPELKSVSRSSDSKMMRTVIHLSLSDSLPSHGSIADMTFSLAKNGERRVPELATVSGFGLLGGFTLFQRDLPTRTKRKLHAIGGARGVWSLPIRQSIKVDGVSYQRPVNPHHRDNDTILISTDATPSPGLSRIASRSSKHDIAITTRIPGTTVGAAPFFQRTAILHVMTNSIRILEPDGVERQIIKDVDGNMPRPKIRSCSICDPFLLILREDDTMGLFIGEPERGKIRRKDMSPMGEKSSRYLAGCFFVDTNNMLETFSTAPGVSNGVDPGATTTFPQVLTTGTCRQWLVLIRAQGVMEIWTLPKLTLAFSTPYLSTLQSVLTDSYDGPNSSMNQESLKGPQSFDIEQVLLAPLGESSPRLHLLVFLRSGQLAIYEVHPTDPPDQSQLNTRKLSLLVCFVKVVSKVFEIQKTEDVGKTVLAEHKRISRLFIPFVTSPTPGVTFYGVFFTGDHPCWILATNSSPVRIHPAGHTLVHSFTTCSLWESKGDFLLYSDEGPSLLEWMPGLQLGTELPSRHVSFPRPYSHVVFDPTTTLIVAASSLKAKFLSFDEDGNKVWEPEAANISEPICDCSTLELIAPDLWITMDGYEFAQNEFVTALDVVTLETASTETGNKQFIAVGTTIDRGEDLAVKGSTYVFEIVEVVPDPSLEFKRWYKLKLCFRDDSKGPVTAVCGFDGYLVSSIGQKIFVRALDSDERLVGVAFLDVGVYVTSLRTLKNLLIIGDAVKSVWFVAFQEDPYKLVILAKDIRHINVSITDFFFNENEMSIVSGDEEGVFRIYDFDSNAPESKNGQHLLCRTEFHGQVACRSSLRIAERTKQDDLIPRSKLFLGCADGSLRSLVPIDESVFKRLQLLQGQLTRNLQHVAGLNPKALRIVKNDFISKPLSKGVLDGNLLSSFENLSITKQDEITRQIGTERAVILRDWMNLVKSW